jgi:hypothetical protein
MPPRVHIYFVVPPPGCGRSVTDFWGWGVYRARFHCPDDVSDDMYERGVPGGALNLNSTGYPDHEDIPIQGKISTAEPGIEPETSWLVVRSSDHQATRLMNNFASNTVSCYLIYVCLTHFGHIITSVFIDQLHLFEWVCICWLLSFLVPKRRNKITNSVPLQINLYGNIRI